MLKFRSTLANFAAMLKDRNVGSKLNVVIKDPSEFTMDYILEIINGLGKASEHPSKTTLCKKFIKSCYRKVEGNKDVIEGFLTMIPDDIYGSVISGGFTLILAASL